MNDLVCKHCGARVESRDEAADRGWQIVMMEVREEHGVVAGGAAAFCPDTPVAVTQAYIEALGRAVVERRILE